MGRIRRENREWETLDYFDTQLIQIIQLETKCGHKSEL
jgi:hypothetical protein